MGKLSRLAIAMLVAATAIPAGAHAQSAGEKTESGLTVYGGYRFGGGFTDVTTGKTWELTEGPSFAVAADFGIDRKTQWQLFISHRNSALKASGFSPAADNIGLGITYYQVGGTYFFEEVGKGGYLVGGLGLTTFSPKSAGLTSETRGSLNLGIGFMAPLGRHVALKVEFRGYATLVNSSSSVFCSGGCVVQISGSTVTQGELLAGIAARF
jgi:hypothetical protein